LEKLRFTGDVWALPEGQLFFKDEPILEVTAPIIEAQLVETFIINQINLPSLIATKWFMSLRSPPEDENGSEER